MHIARIIKTWTALLRMQRQTLLIIIKRMKSLKINNKIIIIKSSGAVLVLSMRDPQFELRVFSSKTAKGFCHLEHG